ncbi:ATP-binding cassette domain-containing protein [Bacillus sp. Xin]|uniref:BacT n=1 Tax=Bacillus sp. Xin1 TaxID=2740676 RepID=A0A7D5ILS6_9BACI|nr:MULTISPECIES: ATP-binding cassette domain-containing protein [unclassified Bacillus (in: firmicutes)]MBC6973920.1 ATP-binding cassette domain-containing protein [Bacillus sp. Xin]NSW39297.1 ATP-binding cassette domain-containing protein [Bacillus sp. Xin1]QLA09668.1 BacT [Bacillus sp. Xin1]
MELTINIKNIGYQTEIIIDKVNINIKNTGLYKLEGSNGSGKSTLFKALNGELDWIKNQDINVELNKKKINVFKNKEIFFINDSFEGYMFLKPVEYITFLSQLYNQKIQHNYMLSIFEKLDFSKFSHHLIKDLSQGNKQKLVFITSLLINCPIILFDEAFEHIDKNSMNYIRNNAKELLNNKIVLLTSHTNTLNDMIKDNLYLEDKKIYY